MAHELHIVNGEARMAYLSEEGTPWHGLGVPLKSNASLEEWATAAGLQWKALKRPLYTVNNEGGLVMLEDDVVIVHSETQQRLGLVGAGFKTVQPIEMLHAYKVIAGELGYQLKTAGNLRGGKRIWALADCGQQFSITPDDVVKRNLLLATSFDGTMATIVDDTAIRVVCQNTFRMAVGDGGENSRIRIPHSADFDPADIRAQLLTVKVEEDKKWELFKGQALQLASRKVTVKEATEFFIKIFAAEGDGTVDVGSLNVRSTLSQIMTLYKDGVGQDTTSAKGTAWGLFNTVTRWADHTRNTRTADSRMERAWFGDSALKKQTALDAALALAA